MTILKSPAPRVPKNSNPMNSGMLFTRRRYSNRYTAPATSIPTAPASFLPNFSTMAEMKGASSSVPPIPTTLATDSAFAFLK